LSWLDDRSPGQNGNDLDRFDPPFVEKLLVSIGKLYGAGRYFDVSMRGLDALPRGPLMLVSNHSGGTSIPDVWGFGAAWYRQFGTHRPLYILSHELLHAIPAASQFFERVGVVRASIALAREILARGRDVLIYPGGDLEVWRTWERRYEVDFGGRSGFARLALEMKVPVVPVAHAGSHETLRVLTSGRAFAKAVGLKRIARAEIWPIHLSLPWGLALGPVPHIPWPARFRYLVGSPMQPPPGMGEKFFAAQVQSAVQSQLSRLEAEDEHRRRNKPPNRFKSFDLIFGAR
jgi:1-acyl-sn-glycerol-3-phosphate acyltransferase